MITPHDAKFIATEKFDSIPYMREEQALFINELITANNLKKCLELGFFHGKSTVYLLEMMNKNKGSVVTIDLPSAINRNPNIYELIKESGLDDTNLTIINDDYSYTWTMMKMIELKNNTFDFCYLDGGHTWDATGFAFFLVDKLLDVNGYIIFDDLNWKISTSSIKDKYSKFQEDYVNTAQVRKVWDLLVTTSGRYKCFEAKKFGWGVAQKIRN